MISVDTRQFCELVLLGLAVKVKEVKDRDTVFIIKINITKKLLL